MSLENTIKILETNGARVTETDKEYIINMDVQGVDTIIHVPKEIEDKIDMGTAYGITPTLAIDYFIIELKNQQPNVEKVELWYNYNGGFNVYLHGKINGTEEFEAVIKDILSSVEIRKK